MSEALKTIETQVQNLQKFYKEKFDFLNQVNANLKQLKNERENVTKQLSEVNGALQAYNESIRLMKLESSAIPAPVPTPAAPVAEVAPVANDGAAVMDGVVEPVAETAAA